MQDNDRRQPKTRENFLRGLSNLGICLKAKRPKTSITLTIGYRRSTDLADGRWLFCMAHGFRKGPHV
jgi:hypothetical protein